MNFTQSEIQDIKLRLRDYCRTNGKYLPLVVFDLVTEGMSIKDILSVRISGIDNTPRIGLEDKNISISRSTYNDILEYLSNTMEMKILKNLTRSDGMRLADLGRSVGLNGPGPWSGLYYNYLKRLMTHGVVEKIEIDGDNYYTVNNVKDYIDSLYLTKLRPDKKSTRESLRGNFKIALRETNTDKDLTPTFFKEICLPLPS